MGAVTERLSGWETDMDTTTATIIGLVIPATVVAAIISGLVSLVGHFVTLRNAQLQVETKIDELTQTQFKDILAKRIDVYPRLWCILQTYLSDWRRKEELMDPNWTPDAKWLPEFLKNLLEWHQENGVFLSEPSYRAFALLGDEAFGLACKCNGEKLQLTPDHIKYLDDLYSFGDRSIKHNGDPRRLALSAWLKNDLGSYQTPLISKPAEEYKKDVRDTVTKIREMLTWPRRSGRFF
jgi:hypothetical protein